MTPDKDYPAIIAGIGAYTAELRRTVPPVMQGFGALARAATAPGSVDAKTKELIALAIGVTSAAMAASAFTARRWRTGRQPRRGGRGSWPVRLHGRRASADVCRRRAARL
ncbi:hypothetical protein [Paracoccus mutanolyticus]|uniref:hypothetical protein n=1 Tax=Paracoccus mutanolyticus TaxID=1499308 RepID=UPI0037CBA2B8